MLDDIKMYKKTILRGFLQLKRPEYLIYAPFETIYHTVDWGYFKELLWLCFWCQTFFPIILITWKYVYILIFGIKHSNIEK